MGVCELWQRPMTGKRSHRISAPSSTLAALRELVSALDRRVPHIERAGETGIARDAQMLRHDALVRIEELEDAESGNPYDPDLVDAMMTDDGGGHRDG